MHLSVVHLQTLYLISLKSMSSRQVVTLAELKPTLTLSSSSQKPWTKIQWKTHSAVRAFNSRELTVDGGSTTNTFTGSGEVSLVTGDLIWDKNAFDVSWNSDDTEVTFTFKEERILPVDKDVNLVPDYQVAFAVNGNRLIKDKSGISRSKEHFKLTDGPLEESFKFAMQTDEKDPGVSSVTAQTDENSGDQW